MVSGKAMYTYRVECKQAEMKQLGEFRVARHAVYVEQNRGGFFD